MHIEGNHISIDELSVTWRDIAKAFQFIRRTDDDNLMEPRPPSTIHLWLLGRGIMFFFYWWGTVVLSCHMNFTSIVLGKFRFHFEIPFINSTVEINLCCCFFSFTITLSSRRGIIQISSPTREELNKYFSSILLNPTHCFALSLQLCGTLGFATNRRWERTQVSILCILN